MTVKRWTYEGVVLGADDKGQVSLEDLRGFLAMAERLDAPIQMFEYGLRCTRMHGDGGPRLDWRD